MIRELIQLDTELLQYCESVRYMIDPSTESLDQKFVVSPLDSLASPIKIEISLYGIHLYAGKTFSYTAQDFENELNCVANFISKIVHEGLREHIVKKTKSQVHIAYSTYGGEEFWKSKYEMKIFRSMMGLEDHELIDSVSLSEFVPYNNS